ncbi:hypothetical protein PCE1_001448 [Barthelona sp. PCE]
MKSPSNNINTNESAETHQLHLLKLRSSIVLQRKRIESEASKTSKIRSRLTRVHVTGSLSSCLTILRSYNRTPKNGLVIFAGFLPCDQGSSFKKFVYSFEPFMPITTNLYICDTTFRVGPIEKLIASCNRDRIGIVVIDGKCALYGRVGQTQEIIYMFDEELPKKQNQGGQSQNRYQRIRVEKRGWYLSHAVDVCNSIFVNDDSTPNIQGLILAGSADFKHEFCQHQDIHYRLKPLILGTVTVAYGGRSGFREAIQKCDNLLADLHFNKERRAANEFFEDVTLNPELIVYGVVETMKAVDMGCVEHLVVSEDLVGYRVEMDNNVRYTTAEPDLEDCETAEPLTDWLIDNALTLKTKITFISASTDAGFQFLQTYGIGGKTFYKLDWDMDILDDDLSQEENSDFDGLDGYF